MGSITGGAARDWFAAARRWYLEGHQGCARCRSQHCVFRSEWGQRVEYHCTTCDFSVSHDGKSGSYFVDMGEPADLPGSWLDGAVADARGVG